MSYPPTDGFHLSELAVKRSTTEKDLTIPLIELSIPETVHSLPRCDNAKLLLEKAEAAVRRFMRTSKKPIENFVTCDFDLASVTLMWIIQKNLASGRQFCELGSGFGVVSMLAASMGFDAIGIEIEPVLVKEASRLAKRLKNNASFYCGSFIPHGILDLLDIERDVDNVLLQEDNIFEEIGLGIEDFDLLFAFPWPGEELFFERLFDQRGASGSMLLTYHGRDGMRLQRKT